MTRSLSASKRTRTRRAHRSHVVACIGLALLACAPLSSCAAGKKYWSFPCSQKFYGGLDGSIPFNSPSSSSSSCNSDKAALAFLAVLLLPFAIDVVLLPVTGTHDVCVAMKH